MKAGITAIVPARNEELNIARCVRSLAQQAEIVEIIVVNDQSTDGTAAALVELGKEIPRLRVVEAGELPADWAGKNHAAWLGAAEARGEWLLFTDADVTHLAGSAARALADAERTGAALVSYSPDQELRTWGERALMPFVFTRLAARFSYEAVSDPKSPVAAANGQYLMIRREAYDRIGGHAAVRREVLEDVALARRVKDSGRPVYFAPGPGVARTRMYRSFAEMWRGWTKNLYPLCGGTLRAAAWEIVRAVGLVFTPLGYFLVLGNSLVAWFLAVSMVAIIHEDYGRQLRRNHCSIWGILCFVPGALLYAGAVWYSSAAYRSGAVEWKGRQFRVDAYGRKDVATKRDSSLRLE